MLSCAGRSSCQRRGRRGHTPARPPHRELRGSCRRAPSRHRAAHPRRGACSRTRARSRCPAPWTRLLWRPPPRRLGTAAAAARRGAFWQPKGSQRLIWRRRPAGSRAAVGARRRRRGGRGWRGQQGTPQGRRPRGGLGTRRRGCARSRTPACTRGTRARTSAARPTAHPLSCSWSAGVPRLSLPPGTPHLAEDLSATVHLECGRLGTDDWHLEYADRA